MSATLLAGAELAAQVRSEVAANVRDFAATFGDRPCLTAVSAGLVGGARAYRRQLARAFESVGIEFRSQEIDKSAEHGGLIELIRELNSQSSVHGIVILTPLPRGVDHAALGQEISPDKDVDGAHPLNAGLLLAGHPRGIPPATPSAAIALLDRYGIEIAGKRAVVVGRSLTVGRPFAMMLLSRHATVTICHSRTPNVAEIVREGDIVGVAVGVPGLVQGSMLQPGSVVIDFGATEVDGRLVGDVEFDSAQPIVSAISPVPGGVGPVTIAMLMRNTMVAATRQQEQTASVTQ